jgi:hypothetical protein
MDKTLPTRDINPEQGSDQLRMIAHHHLQTCQSQINGYWDEDDRVKDCL